MKKHIGVSMILAIACSGALAEQYEDYARVRSATPEYERVNAPRDDCYSEYVPATRGYEERGYGGSILGGVAGGLIGSQVGRGNGSKVATAAGAIAGAVAGDRIQNNARIDDGREVRHCRRVDQWENRLSGYRVVYEYDGRTYTTVLPYDPGRKMRVRVSVDPMEIGNSRSFNPF